MEELLLGLGTNLLSSIVYDIGKKCFSKKGNNISEEEIKNIIEEHVLEIETRINHIEAQNDMILKLILQIFNNNENFNIQNYENNYVVYNCPQITVLQNTIYSEVEKFNQKYLDYAPQSLSNAIWPIPKNLKEDLLNELEESFNEDFK